MTTTLAEIITSVRYRIDEASANRWSDAELTHYINRRLNWLQSKIESYNSDYFIRVQNPTAASGTYNMGLPSDIRGKNVRAVRVFEGSTTAALSTQGSRVEPKPLEWVMANRHQAGIPEGYCIIDGYFEWAPQLATASIFRFVYAVKEGALTATAQTLDYISDEFIDVIADAAAIDALIKTSDFGKIATLQGVITERLRQISNDVQPIDPIMIPQVEID